MRQYLDLVRLILDQGDRKEDRTGVGTISVFGVQSKYDLAEGFPLVTTKKVSFKNIVVELLWFLRGDTNIQYLVQRDVNIWNEWAFQVYLEKEGLLEKYPRYSEEWKAAMKEFVATMKGDEAFAKLWGELGPIYGKQWRRWLAASGEEIDQIAGVLDLIRNDPSSRRIIVSGWNVGEIQELVRSHHHAPPSCHTLFQFCVVNGRLDLQLYQRSADIGLGVPYNVASYAILLMIISQETGLTPGIFTHTIGDAHIYTNHEAGLREQLTREPHAHPTVTIAKKPMAQLDLEDFTLAGYEPDAAIKLQIAV